MSTLDKLHGNCFITTSNFKSHYKQKQELTPLFFGLLFCFGKLHEFAQRSHNLNKVVNFNIFTIVKMLPSGVLSD
ncbi:hypothetical protein B6A42_00065 [Vibrio coralliilyticus]|nr:hypothetical protein B6A42_00065 [Vibrio coralliilyticus]